MSIAATSGTFVLDVNAHGTTAGECNEDQFS